MIDRIDHLGIAVHKLEDAIPLYEKALGLTCERIEEIPSQKVRTAFFKVGETHVELLEPTADDSPVAKFLASRGEGVHHVAFHSSDLPAQLRQAADAGVRLVNETPTIGAGGKRIAFLHPKSTRGVMVELCREGD
ncbi:MAG: methylmalonyl-CoA epimerase [Proteobacteria bacterium]|jgi:methylmalonyl-CoA/ethylmalonyl-CoA epimerase|nr:methylmalonyl-CoA epimerase [Pseudomonadota bacterium]